MDQGTNFRVSSSPHIRTSEDTKSIMLDVIIALVPALVIAMYMFGIKALVLCTVSSASCVFFEWAYRKLMKKTNDISDLSAVVTGMLLSFCLPVTVPLWLPVVGAFFSIIIVKQLFGGIGKNFMNPALAGRAFLFSWPVIMTTWLQPLTYSSFFSFPGTAPDTLSTATPLAALSASIPALPANYTLAQTFFGQIPGSMGEISVFALLLGGLYLILRRVITPRIPLTYILTVAIITFIFPRGDIPRLEWMLWNVCSGGIILGAVFMATDYSTSPVTVRGQYIFAFGCGALTVFIRYFGSYPEGVTYAILCMNACVWLLDKVGASKRFGMTKEMRKKVRPEAKEADSK